MTWTITRALPLALAGSILLAGCNQNTALGNDREAELYPAPEAAPIVSVEEALANVAVEIVKPETMSDADIRAIGGTADRCVFRLTEMSFPAFVYEAGGDAFIKLNGKLVPLRASGENRYMAGGLLIVTRLIDETGNAGLQMQEMMMVPPDAKDELGYRGFAQCYGTVSA